MRNKKSSLLSFVDTFRSVFLAGFILGIGASLFLVITTDNLSSVFSFFIFSLGFVGLFYEKIKKFKLGSGGVEADLNNMSLDLLKDSIEIKKLELINQTYLISQEGQVQESVQTDINSAIIKSLDELVEDIYVRFG